ncbi:hypothetical protein V2J09_023221 [Rumex salicifolius]
MEGNIKISISLPFDVALKIASSLPDWKGFYAKRHKEIANASASVVSFINQSTSESNSIDLRGYRKVYDQLALVQFGFNDIDSFLFDSEISIVLNLLGLHYSIKCLKVPPEIAVEALRRRKIYERGFKIECIKLVRQNFQCTLVSERQSRSFSLHNLAMADLDTEEEDEQLRHINTKL